jgi:Fe-S-cluster-containing hydrogenase component 2
LKRLCQGSMICMAQTTYLMVLRHDAVVQCMYGCYQCTVQCAIGAISLTTDVATTVAKESKMVPTANAKASESVFSQIFVK